MNCKLLLAVVCVLLLIVTMGPFCALAEEGASASTSTGEPTTKAVEEAVLEGHSYHGEVFNTGPRQAAYLMQGTGNVHFPATCKSPEVQAFIDQGIGQLHGFWYFESERSFRQAAALDPECGIAYLGMALSNRGNENRARGFMAEAVKHQKDLTEFERKHISAWAEFFRERTEKEKKDKDWDKNRRQKLVKEYERILYDHPDDVETKAFLCLMLYENKSKGLPQSSFLAVDAFMKEILAANPMHPCHHFRIHHWDNERPQLALDSADKCGASAPGIAHMWHMPGHIYSKLHRYHDAVWQQEASARVDHAHMMRDRVMPDQIHNFAHNNEWLIRNLIHLGDVPRARELALNMLELPRHPAFNTFEKHGSAYYGRLRLLQLLEEFENWDDLMALCDSGVIEETDSEGEQESRLRALGLAALERQQFESAADIVAEVSLRLAKVRESQAAAEMAAEVEAKRAGKDEAAVKKAKEAARNAQLPKRRRLEQLQLELQAGQLFQQGQYAEALREYGKVTNLSKQWLARAQWQAGEHDKALTTLRDAVKDHENEVLPLARLIDMLWQAENRKEAEERFQQLRPLASDFDLSSTPAQRLAAIAAELGYPADWRLPRVLPQDVGPRPELDELGPFRWSPSPAPAWELTDHVGNQLQLEQYRGKPVVVIFFLGHACLHCAEQLQAFAPQTQAFADHGIQLVAISTDSQADLQLSQENYGKEPFPFPIVTNHDLGVFKSYRCYDDFESIPLHGTFLVDAQGQVRWQDIGYEPFMNPQFILEEAQRTLRLKSESLVVARGGEHLKGAQPVSVGQPN